MEQSQVASALGSETQVRSSLLVVFVPNMDRENQPVLDAGLWAIQCRELFARLFGGATQFPGALGSWYDEENDVMVNEETILVQSYAPDDQVTQERIERLAEFCHRFGRETNQGEVGVLYDGTFHRIRRYRPAPEA